MFNHNVVEINCHLHGKSHYYYIDKEKYPTMTMKHLVDELAGLYQYGGFQLGISNPSILSNASPRQNVYELVKECEKNNLFNPYYSDDGKKMDRISIRVDLAVTCDARHAFSNLVTCVKLESPDGTKSQDVSSMYQCVYSKDSFYRKACRRIHFTNNDDCMYVTAGHYILNIHLNSIQAWTLAHVHPIIKSGNFSLQRLQVNNTFENIPLKFDERSFYYGLDEVARITCHISKLKSGIYKFSYGIHPENITIAEYPDYKYSPSTAHHETVFVLNANNKKISSDFDFNCLVCQEDKEERVFVCKQCCKLMDTNCVKKWFETNNSNFLCFNCQTPILG